MRVNRGLRTSRTRACGPADKRASRSLQMANVSAAASYASVCVRVCVCLAGCSLTNKLVHRREPLLLLLRDATILLAIRTRGPFRNCQRARDVSVEGTQVGQSRTRQCGLVSRKQQLRALRLAGVGACMCACVPCVRACHVCVMCAVCVRGVCAHLVFCLVTCSRPAGSFKSLISAPAACACAARRTAFSIARCFSCSARCSSETHAHTQADAQYPRHAVSDSSRLSKSPRVPIVCMCPRVFPSLPVCVCVNMWQHIPVMLTSSSSGFFFLCDLALSFGNGFEGSSAATAAAAAAAAAFAAAADGGGIRRFFSSSVSPSKDCSLIYHTSKRHHTSFRQVGKGTFRLRPTNPNGEACASKC